MHFSKENLEKLKKEYLTISGKHQKLMESYVIRDYKNPKAKEYATQGFSRRLNTLVHCIDNVFKIIPPDRIDLPTSDERSDVMINIQAFVTNVFGSMDNLAWIWVEESGLTKEDKSPLPNSWVGLGEKNKLVRKSFSPKFQKYLNGLGDWLKNLVDFRDALAHRIPLYIPPYVVLDSKEPAYQDLENRMAEAIKQQDFAEHERLSAEQMALVEFRPYMTHSFEEKANIVVFHPQLMADFNTIEELGREMLEELDH